MKKRFTLVLSMLLMVGLVYDYNFRMAHTNSAGGPAGHTGSPADGQTCARSGCHAGGPTATNEAIDLSSDIPASGYVAGETYNITFTMTKAGGQKFGFQLSAQDDNGTGLGTITAGLGSQIVGGKYITHSIGGTTASSGVKTWDFQWEAPAAGTGDVDVYYVGNFTDNASSTSGDVVVSGSITLSESALGISEAQLEALSVYPNPIVDEVYVVTKDVDEEIMITMFDVQGRKLIAETYNSGSNIVIDVKQHGLKTGIYIMQIEVDGKSTAKRLMVK